MKRSPQSEIPATPRASPRAQGSFKALLEPFQGQAKAGLALPHLARGRAHAPRLHDLIEDLQQIPIEVAPGISLVGHEMNLTRRQGYILARPVCRPNGVNETKQ
jgi:hypothetical protein